MQMIQTLLERAKHNCWGQADALFAVCMAEAERAEARGFTAAKKAMQQNNFAIQIRLQSIEAGLPSVHAWVCVCQEDVVSICQAYQSAELPMHVTCEVEKECFRSYVSELGSHVGRRKRVQWPSIRETAQRLCRLDLADCFSSDSRICVDVFSVSWESHV